MERISSRITYAPLRRRTLASRLWAMIGLARQRRDLATLDQHMLDDIGITPHEAHTEAQRRSWDAPDHWQR